MVAPTKKFLRSLGINVLGGVLAFPTAQGVVFALGFFYSLPTGIETFIFVTTYSGLVCVFIFRVWDDVRTFSEDAQIFFILNDEKVLPIETELHPTALKLYDDETYDLFKILLCGFPREFTVTKFNRLFFLNGIGSLPSPKLQEAVSNQMEFSQILGRLKSDNFVRTDGFSFSIQFTSWEERREELMLNKPEFEKWQEIAGQLIKQNQS
ncbi:MAG: hypothetical protein V1794_06490 [Candidatus Glassbacteria bacterium]